MFTNQLRHPFNGLGFAEDAAQTPKQAGYAWGPGRKSWYKIKKPDVVIPFRSKPEWIPYIPRKLYSYAFGKKGWIVKTAANPAKTLILRTDIPEWDSYVPPTPVWLAPDMTKSPLAQGFLWNNVKQGWYHPKNPTLSFIARAAAPSWFFYIPGIRKALQAEYIKLWANGSIPKEMTFDQWLATRPITEPVVEPEPTPTPTPTPEPTPTDGGGGGTAPTEPTPADGQWMVDPLTGQYIFVPTEPAATTNGETTPTTPTVSTAGFQLPEKWPIYGILAIGAFLVFRGGKGKEKGSKRRRR